jgi:hypothetical protein
MIQAFCCFYNEAALVPFFLAHYHDGYVDAIHAIVDTTSTDETRALLSADPRVTIQDVAMPAGFDDVIKVGWLNDAIRLPTPHAWQLVLDADEFIHPPGDPGGTTAAAYLASVPEGCLVLEANRMDVFRYETDADLDVTQAPVVWQRRHGIENSPNAKPIVIRANRGLQFQVGNHRLTTDVPVCGTHHFEGAHWQNADPSFAIVRRVRDRKERMSAANRHARLGWHHFDKTAEDVAAELEAHRHDGLVL